MPINRITFTKKHRIHSLDLVAAVDLQYWQNCSKMFKVRHRMLRMRTLLHSIRRYSKHFLLNVLRAKPIFSECIAKGSCLTLGTTTTTTPSSKYTTRTSPKRHVLKLPRLRHKPRFAIPEVSLCAALLYLPFRKTLL